MDLKPPKDNISPHHMPSGACSNVMKDTHIKYEWAPYETTLYESLTYENWLDFDQYDLVVICAETRENVDVNMEESEQQDESRLA
ncbi:hypothetical protein [Lacrimispora brassicae]